MGCLLFLLFVVSFAIPYDLLIFLFKFSTDNVPDWVIEWSIGITIVFWMAILLLMVYVDMLEKARQKEAILKTHPSELSPRDFEQFTSIWMENHGYVNVKIVGQSGDFGADIIGEDNTRRKIVVQCKRYKGGTGVRAVQEAFSARSYYNCERSAVFTTGHFTRQAKELAVKNGVELYRWNGSKFMVDS